MPIPSIERTVNGLRSSSAGHAVGRDEFRGHQAHCVTLEAALLARTRIVYSSRSFAELVLAVHSDITALLNAGVLDRAEGSGIVFPFEAVKVEFLLQAA